MPTFTVIGSKMLHPHLALYCHFRFELKYLRHFMMYHRRGRQHTLQQRVFSLLDTMQPTSPFAFYSHVSLKTKENRNFKALFSPVWHVFKNPELNSCNQAIPETGTASWQIEIPCLPGTFVLTGMDGSSLQTWNDRNTFKRKQRWTKRILSSNIYKVTFKTKKNE